MTETSQGSSPYDPEKFVDREEEIKQVIALLRQSQPRVRAIVVDGNRGVGKTWLSLHLHRTVFKKEIRGMTSWLFSLWSPGENYRPEGEQQQANEQFMRENEQLEIDEFLSTIIHGLVIELPPKPILAEKVDAVRRYIQSHADERFVVILDSAYESDWKLLEQLETHFLGNLLTLSNFFVIVTGRGRPYPWKIPFLIEAVHFGLGKFTIEQVQEQLKKFNMSATLSTQDIYNIGDGWPLFTEHLARAKDRTEALDIMATILFQVVPSHERPQIRKYFEALCSLDGFGETEAALMVEAYNPKALDRDGREICRKMNATRLVSWRDGGYVINQPVKKILRDYLRFNWPDKWIQLNCVAYTRFKKLSDDPSHMRFRPFFEQKAGFHAGILSEVGIQDIETCSKQKN